MRCRTLCSANGVQHSGLRVTVEIFEKLFVGAGDGISLSAALRRVWDLDDVGSSFYDCSEIAKEVLTKIDAGNS